MNLSDQMYPSDQGEHAYGDTYDETFENEEDPVESHDVMYSKNMTQ